MPNPSINTVWLTAGFARLKLAGYVRRWAAKMSLRTFTYLAAISFCPFANAETGGQTGVMLDDPCNSISGFYKIAGEYLPPLSQNAKARMDWTLFLKEYSGKPTGIELAWNGADSFLGVKIHGENVSLHENLNYSIKATCRDGELIYTVEHEGYSEGGTKSKARLSAKLTKDSSENLVIDGLIFVESSDLLILKRPHENKIHARFFPL